MKQNKRRSPLKLILIFCFLSVLIIIISFWLFILQKEEIIKQKHEELSVIADMKINDIVHWREERIIDISGKSDSKIFSEAVGKWFNNPNNEGLKNIIISDLNSLVKFDRYQAIIIFDSKGNNQLTLLGTVEKLSENSLANYQQTIKSKEPVFGDFYMCNICGDVHLDIIAPLIDDGKVIGGLLLRIDRDNFLNPLIKSWPTPSKTSESFLVRKEGNEVVFLNELRRYENSTLKLKFTLTDENSIIPSVMAAKGIEGMVEGIDYSGEPVIADIKKVPGTNWFKISKVDIKEVYAPIKEKALYIILFAGVLILSVGIGFYQIWKSEEKSLLLQEAEAELRHQAMLKHFEYIMKYANDLIILSDVNLDIVEVNNSAEIAYGYTRDEMLKMNIKDILSTETYVIDDEIKRYGDSEKGILFETIHRRKDGTTFNVEVSIRKIEYKGKKYFQRIIRDITERKRAESSLIDSEKRLRELAHHLQSIREDERTKMSRTLHDNFGQSLTGLKMEISSIEKKLSKFFNLTDNPEISGKIKSMKTTIDELALLTSVISMQLRPNVLDMLGLKPAIEWLAEDFKSKSEINCKLNTDLENIDLDPATSTEVFRIMQESLTNVIRHANATHVDINIYIKNNNYVIEVKDNGRGINQSEFSSPYSMGILGMKERAVLFGGEINFSEGEGKGTKVSIIIPITKI